MRAKLFILLMAVALIWSGCGVGGGLKPTTVQTTADETDRVMSELERALQEMDWDALEELLADEVYLNDELISKDDREALQRFLGDYDSVAIDEEKRVTSDDTIVISTELYLKLIEAGLEINHTSELDIILINVGDKWTGDRWVISELRRNQSIYEFDRELSPDLGHLISRFVAAFQGKQFDELIHLFANNPLYVSRTEANRVDLYSGMTVLHFIGELEEDFSDVTVRQFEVVGQAAADTTLVLTIDMEFEQADSIVSATKAVQLVCRPAGGGWEIASVEYDSIAFGLL